MRAKKGTVDYNEEELIRVYPQYVDDIQLLGNHYKDFSDYYNQAVSNYNKIIKQIKGWDATADSNKTSKQIQKWIRKIDKVCNELENKKQSIKSLKTYRLNRDFSIVRTKYINAVNTLLSDFSYMKETFNEIKEVSDKMNEMFASDSSDEVEGILSKIYLLGVEEKNIGKSSNENGGTTSENNEGGGTTSENNEGGGIISENLIEEINDLMLSVSKEGNSESEMMSDLVWLKDAIQQYSEYMELKNNLLDYRKVHVQTTYSFEMTGENKISENSLET